MSYEIIFKYFKQKVCAQEELRREAIGAHRAICHVGAHRAIKRQAFVELSIGAQQAIKR